MFIQMFVGDIGDASHIKIDRSHPPLVKAVAGALDHSIGAIGITHLCQQALDIWGIRRGDMQTGVDLSTPDPRAHRGNHPDAALRGAGCNGCLFEDRFQ